MTITKLACALSFVLTGCANLNCSNGWQVTGYYTPVESDFQQQPQESVLVSSIGHRSFSSDFLKSVRIEGWGRTSNNWYLGFYNQQWHQSKSPLDASGNKLKIGSVATDPSIIKMGSTVKIPSLETVYRNRVYIAKDVGSAINGKHIDIYTGEGNGAKTISWNITSNNHQVCI